MSGVLPHCQCSPYGGTILKSHVRFLFAWLGKRTSWDRSRGKVSRRRARADGGQGQQLATSPISCTFVDCRVCQHAQSVCLGSRAQPILAQRTIDHRVHVAQPCVTQVLRTRCDVPQRAISPMGWTRRRVWKSCHTSVSPTQARSFFGVPKDAAAQPARPTGHAGVLANPNEFLGSQIFRSGPHIFMQGYNPHCSKDSG